MLVCVCLMIEMYAVSMYTEVWESYWTCCDVEDDDDHHVDQDNDEEIIKELISSNGEEVSGLGLHKTFHCTS